jgi:sulfatase maturation enzyme AslB (radical SAM superfamily)
MNFSTFIVGITADCNYRCSYCYQRRTDTCLDRTTAFKALDFFFPFLAPDCDVVFYGGEPLLGLGLVKEVVRRLRNLEAGSGKKTAFSVSTNGSLIDDRTLDFFEENGFTVLLSFDGLAQEQSRKEGTFLPTVALLETILERKGIHLETNSVFTAETVGRLAESIRFMVDRGVSSANISLSNRPSWSPSALARLKEELETLGEGILPVSRRNRAIPVVNFRRGPGGRVFGCSAGEDRIFLAPDGTLWGCCLIHDYLSGLGRNGAPSRYCFGGLDAFVDGHERIYPEVVDRHRRFRMDNYFTPDRYCAQCEDLTDCVVCPVDTILGDSLVGKIPGWACRIRQIERETRNRFLNEIGG